MDSIKIRLTLIFFIFFLVSPLHAAPKMLLEVDRTSIDADETLQYGITLVDSQPIDDSLMPDVSAIVDFNVQSLSQNRLSQYFNGKQTYSIRFAYVLTPKKNDSLSIPVPKIIVGGQTLKPESLIIGGRTVQVPPGGVISISVRKPTDQDIVFMKIEADHPQLYPFQPLTISLVIQVKGLPEKLDPRQSTNPVQVLRTPPQLSIPWAKQDASLPKGIVPAQEITEWLSGLLNKQYGFAINNFSNGGIDLFRSSMLQPTLLQFSPQSKKITRPDGSGKETTYWEYRFARTFQPKEIGKYSFGPVVLKGTFAAADPNTENGTTAMNIYMQAPEIQVEVVGVPQEGRPKEFIGAFGTFDWSVDLQPRQAKVGDPMTLTLHLKGQGSTADIKAPDLLQNPEITANFKVYPPTEDVNDKSCTFTYTIRPLKEGAIVFPPLAVVFFDVEKENFETLRSEPISLEISEAKVLRTAPAFGNMPAFSNDLERSEKGLFANITDPRSAADQSVDYARWAITMVSLPVLYGLLAIGVFVWRRRYSNPKLQRRRRAFSRAQQRLMTIHGSASAVSEACNLLQGVFLGYAADLTDGIEHGMTSQEACRKWLELSISEQTINSARKFLETLDAARYGGLDLRKLDELTVEGENLLKRLQEEIERNR